jgi:protein-S-isoprenylcysteine O-methyltransferase Ste14
MPSPGGIIYLAGLIFAEALRLPQRSHRKAGQNRQETQNSPVRRLEWLVLLGIVGGIWALPLLYIFTRQLAALSYRLPSWSFWPATFVFAVSLAIRWQAHRALGRQWSHTLRTASDHTLVSDGIYHYLRHPIYVSLVLWAAAQPILLQNWLAGWGGAVAVALIWLIRVPREEQMMLDRFGPTYRDYMARTGLLFPRRSTNIEEEVETEEDDGRV